MAGGWANPKKSYTITCYEFHIEVIRQHRGDVLPFYLRELYLAPDGFNASVNGIRQMCYAILRDYVGRPKARKFYEDLAEGLTKFIQNGKETWELFGEDIDNFLRNFPPSALERVAGEEMFPGA